MNNSREQEEEVQIDALFALAEKRAISNRRQFLEPRLDIEDEAALSELRILTVAIRELERRAIRRRHLPTEMFSDDCWCILLDLFIADHQKREVKLSEAGKRWNLSEATATRYIVALIEAKIVFRTRDKLEENTTIILLTDFGRIVLKRLLAMHE